MVPLQHGRGAANIARVCRRVLGLAQPVEVAA
jgi:hypothetical protein